MNDRSALASLRDTIKTYRIRLAPDDARQQPLFIPCHVACVLFKCSNFGRGRDPDDA